MGLKLYLGPDLMKQLFPSIKLLNVNTIIYNFLVSVQILSILWKKINKIQKDIRVHYHYIILNLKKNIVFNKT